MTDTRMNEIRARHDAATPGPWGTSRDLGGNYTVKHGTYVTPEDGFGSDGDVAVLLGDEEAAYANGSFIARAREDIPYLLDRIAALEATAPETEAVDIHTHFSFSYANYLVLPRTLLQSMPAEWQTQFVALLEEMDTAFEHVTQAQAYEVTPGMEVIVDEMGFDLLEEAGIKQDWYGGEKPPEGLDEAALNEWKAVHEVDAPKYYARDGREMDTNERVFVADLPDPVPHYNRGRTRVEPATNQTVEA
jgi:hypothetical protein